MLRWRVKELIEARGISMRQLARKAKVSYRTIQMICQDPFRSHKILTSTWEKLAKALDVPLSAVLESIPSDDQQAQMGGHYEASTGLVGKQEAITSVAENLEHV